MAIKRFTAQAFRCLTAIELEPAPDYTLIIGANASGKTSLLEALAYLGRGKSFRGAPPGTLIQHGEQAFVLFGQVEAGGRLVSVGARNSRAGLEVKVDGDTSGGAAALADAHLATGGLALPGVAAAALAAAVGAWRLGLGGAATAFEARAAPMRERLAGGA